MNITRLITVGMNGEDVRFIQNKLNKLKFYNGPSNGIFDRVLLLSIQKYQKIKGLDDDGKVGMLTWNTLSADNASAPSVTLPEKEVIVVANIVKPEVKKESSSVISVESLMNIFKSKNYTWYEDRPNLIGIRTTLQVPDVFNDLFICVWKETLTSEYQMKTWTITTDPGVYWLNNPLNVNGTAYLKPGQYINSHIIGLHQGKADHPALVQRGSLSVYRDNDKDGVAEETGNVETGSGFGINIHRSNATGKTSQIKTWSAGCQVFQQKSDHDQLMTIVNKFKESTGNKFTYTLLKESEL